jgi:hypothetical protein
VRELAGRYARSGARFLAVLLVGAVPGLTVQPVERPESDVLLLSVRLDRSLLSESLPAYPTGGCLLVPLGEISRLLDLGIQVDVAQGLASGFFLSPERLFELDLGAQKVLVEGKAKRFDPACIEAHPDDIYVDTALLSEWLPLHLDVDLFASAITVQPGEPFPLQLRLEREKKLAAALAGQPSKRARYPKSQLPYRLFDGPFLDQTLQWTRQGLPQGGSENALQYSTYVTGDLLFAEANLFVSGTSHELSGSRFSLGRKDPDGHLLGFLGAREVTVGDVSHPGLGLIALPRSGPGLLISNYPLQLPAQFDLQSFRGDLPPGWEAELYRDRELLAYAQSRPDGLYEFLDVPVLFGLNVFRLELYGPQGQHRSETQIRNVGDTLTPKGKVYYRLAGNDPGARLIGAPQVAAGARSTLEVSAGLTRNLSASVSAGSVELADGRHTYGQGGLRAFLGGLFANVDAAQEIGGGSVWQGTLNTRLGAFGLQLQHAELDRFVGETFAAGKPLASRTRLRLNAVVPETFLPRIPVLVEVRQDQLENGQRINELTSRVSVFARGFSVANQLNWSFLSGGDFQRPGNTNGRLFVSKSLPAFALRGEIDYAVKPRQELTAALLTAETRLIRDSLVSAGVNRQFSNGQTQWLAGLSKLQGPFGFGFTVNYSQSGGLGTRLFLALCFGRDSRNGTWHSQARPLAGLGGVSGLAFLDTNGNGRADDGEPPIPDAGFLLNGAGSLARTDERGELFLPNLTPYQDLDFSLAASTLEDPFWRSSREGVRFVPRPGKVALVDFPVQVTGEITGTIYLRRDGTKLEASGIELELVDPQGIVVQKIISGYDGFYDLTDIRPGRYTLRVAGDQLSRLHLLAAPAREVVMAPSGTVLDGIDFVLDRTLVANFAGGE